MHSTRGAGCSRVHGISKATSLRVVEPGAAKYTTLICVASGQLREKQDGLLNMGKEKLR
jgi:hypothetical protein